MLLYQVLKGIKMFKTELHLHSSEVSNCGHVAAENIVKFYKEAGYDTVVLTNHMSKFTFRKENKGAWDGMTWDEKVKFFLDGYYKLKDVSGDRLNIILGIELRFHKCDNDFLVYGVTEEFLKQSGDLMEMSLKTVKPIFEKNNILIYQAHPFRNGMEIMKPALLDGIEVFNGHPNQESRNNFARLWAEKFSLPGISGSDYHHPYQKPNGGILTDNEIKTNDDLVSVLRSGNYQLITY